MEYCLEKIFNDMQRGNLQTVKEKIHLDLIKNYGHLAETVAPVAAALEHIARTEGDWAKEQFVEKILHSPRPEMSEELSRMLNNTVGCVTAGQFVEKLKTLKL